MSDKKTAVKLPLMTTSFRDRESAERAYTSLEGRGYKTKDIHVLMTDETRKRLFAKDSPKTNMGNQAMKGAGVGGAVGGVVGATAVGIAAAAAAVTVPILGLVIIGPLAGAVAGAAAGATAGGVVGMLVGAGIPEDRAKLHKSELDNGSIILGVTPRDDDEVHFFESEWRTKRAKH
jgi:hypothetical protein